MTGNESKRTHTVISSFNKAFSLKTYINPNGVRIIAKTCLEYMGLNLWHFLISQNISANLKGPKETNMNCLMDDVRGFSQGRQTTQMFEKYVVYVP